MIDSGYKTTIDAVWLADAVAAGGNETVLDVGIGAGGVALSLLERFPNLSVTGLDVSEDMLSHAWTNALLNGREIEMIKDSIFDWKTNAAFDIVVTNPPYFSGTPREDDAHHNVDIYEWTRASAKRVTPRGMFYAIAAPDVMDKIIAALVDGNFGGVSILPIATKPDNIERVIISARLNVKTPAKMFFPIDAACKKDV